MSDSTQPEEGDKSTQRRSPLQSLKEHHTLTEDIVKKEKPITNVLNWGIMPEQWLHIYNASAVGTANLNIMWKISLQLYANNAKISLGLYLTRDTIMGRFSPDSLVDIDLTPYNAAPNGVSRSHCMLRPTIDRVFIIDLNSTNGTQVNSMRISPSLAQPIHSGDIINLGNLAFKIIIESVK